MSISMHAFDIDESTYDVMRNMNGNRHSGIGFSSAN